MRIYHNIPALNALRVNQKNINQSTKILEQLSSGIRINKAADDAAGLAISQKMRSQIRGLEKAERNILDGVSLIQTAEGGLQTIQKMLQRARELAVQAANDSFTDTDRELIQNEIDKLKQGIDQIANQTHFNNIYLLNGGLGSTQSPGGGSISSPDWADNVLQDPVINSQGQLYFSTNEGYPDSTIDDNQRLVYDSGTSAIYSKPSVWIDGDQVYLDQSMTYNSSTKEFTDGANGLKVTQLVEKAGYYKDKFEVKYIIENTSSSNKNIGFQFHMDTKIGDDDAAPFIVNGTNIFNNIEYSGNNVPDSFIVYNNTNTGTSNNELQAHGILKTTTITHGAGATSTFDILIPPDKFRIGRYSEVDDRSWTTTTGTNPFGDSGYSVIWDERALAPGESMEVNTFYGISVPPTISDPPGPDNNFNGPLKIQTGPNAGNIFEIELTDARTNALGIDNLSVLTSTNAQSAIGLIDVAIQKVSSERSKFGAFQNALEHIFNNAGNYNENITGAESRISDADMALTMTKFAKSNILNQSSQAMLAQSNQMPQGILQLLK